MRSIAIGTAVVAACVAATLTSGCSTPREARELALQGAVMADKAQAESDAFVERATQAYRRREAIVRELARGEIQDVSARDFRAFIAARARLPQEQRSVEVIHELADKSRESRERVETAFKALEAKLGDAAGPPAPGNATALAEARKAFLVLSQELTPAEWLAFTQAYLKQVNQDLQAMQAPPAP